MTGDIEDWTGEIHQGGAREVLSGIPEKSIDCCVTSPPFYALRNYGDEVEKIWDEDDDCDHQWGDTIGRQEEGGGDNDAVPDRFKQTRQSHMGGSSGQFCQKCGAWKGQFGLEPTPHMYVSHLIEIGRSVKRVLKDTGTWWLNLGDTYSGGGGVAGKPDDWDDLHDDDIYPEAVPARNTEYPEKCKMLIPHRVAIALIDDGWICRNDAVWCLSASTKVYARTQKREGPMMVKDIARLDPETVELWNGKNWTRVVDFYKNNSSREEIRLTLRSGEEINCTGDHLWPTENGLVKARNLSVGDSLKETTLPEPNHNDISDPEFLDEEDIGWFVGIYLAEGSWGKGGDVIQIAGHCNEMERYERLKKIADSYHGTCRKHDLKGDSSTINMYGDVLTGIIKQYIKGDNAKNKRLSKKCWMRSDLFLDSVLEGYLEGDGHYDRENDRWRLGFCRNPYLASDLRTICARLGYQIRLQKAWVDGHGAYRGEIRFSTGNHHNQRKDTEIIDIEDSSCTTFYDIEVEDEPHLFSLASGVLTHNSKPNPMPESVKDRLSTTFEFFFLFSKQKKYYFDLDAIREPHKTDYSSHDGGNENIDGTWSDEGVPRHRARGIGSPVGINPSGKNPGDVFEVNVANFPDAHFATFPPDLIKKPIKASCPEKICRDCGVPYEREVEVNKIKISDSPRYSGVEMRNDSEDSWFESVRNHVGWEKQCDCDTEETQPGIVLDPFMGSGTTAVVAEKLQRRWIGIDLNPQYVDMSEDRLFEETDFNVNPISDW